MVASKPSSDFLKVYLDVGRHKSVHKQTGLSIEEKNKQTVEPLTKAVEQCRKNVKAASESTGRQGNQAGSFADGDAANAARQSGRTTR